MPSMCTKEEAQEAVKEALADVGTDGMTLLQRELVHEGDSIVRKVTFRFGWSVLGLAVGATVAWFGLEFRLSAIEAKMSEGGRYTKEMSVEDKARQLERDNLQDNRIAEFREDVSKQLQNMDTKLDTMQTLLYQIARGQ